MMNCTTWIIVVAGLTTTKIGVVPVGSDGGTGRDSGPQVAGHVK